MHNLLYEIRTAGLRICRRRRRRRRRRKKSNFKEKITRRKVCDLLQ
jgi:hypothetical protein